MINYGLKLGSNNEQFFEEAVLLHNKKHFDFIELYNNANDIFDIDKLGLLKNISIFVHNANDCGFHEFKIRSRQLGIWEKTKQLADYFNSPHIVVHSGIANEFDEFVRNLDKIDDPRILIENMAGLDLNNELTFGYSLGELKKIKKIKNICFDLEKAVKSAHYQNIDYKEFINQCLVELKPFYFHISGGDKNTARDEHLNLDESNFDIKWMKIKLQNIAQKNDIYLVFEVPKNKDNLKNDLNNIEFFKKI